MRGSWVRSIAAVGVWALVGGGLAVPASAQEARAVVPELRARVQQTPTELDQQRAEVTREELRDLMQRYPPALGRVLKLDPTLLSNSAYLAPYPALTTYLQRHPEVPRYPDYFLNFVGDTHWYEPQTPEVTMRRDAMNAWRDMFFGVMVFAGLLTAVLDFRLAHSLRGWTSAVAAKRQDPDRRSQPAHGALLFQRRADEPTSSRRPAASSCRACPRRRNCRMRLPWRRRSLASCGRCRRESSSSAPASVCSPSSRYMFDEVAEMLLVWGVLGLSVGVGFVLAAGASYILSHRLGLFDAAHDGGAKGA